MTTRPVRFFHRGALVEIDARAPTRSVLDWLREDARCTGTKEGCAEGDCGACTVVVGTPRDGTLVLEPVNACIRFLPTLDGRALYTVEDVGTPGALHPVGIDALHPVGIDELHPVQRALVDCHGSQCGFCTPGFVMSLWAVWLQHRAAGTRPTRQQLADALSGNLCRCTGYRPILDAGERMFALPGALPDTAAALAALQGDDALATPGFDAPRTLDDFAALRLAHPDARLLAGATDIGLWVTKQFRDLPALISINEVAELRRIDVADGVLRIGAAASLEAAWTALVARFPTLRDVWLRFASPPIRNAGTMGGNVANGSPIGDAAPVLMALGATLLLRRGDAVRELPLTDFYLGYQRNALEAGEFLQALHVPLAAPQHLRAYKLSKRYDSDISAVLAALAIDLDADGRVVAARLAFGGMAAVVKRAAAAEAAVLGRPWTEATVDAARAALAGDFQPLSDMRASAGYRLRAAQNLLTRFWLETRADAPLPEHAVSVNAHAAVA